MRGSSTPNTVVSAKQKFEPLIDPKAQRHADLKGDKNLVYYCKPRDPSFTHYNGFFMGKQVPDQEKAEIIDTFTVSAMQMPSPDPQLMRRSLQKQERFNRDI